VARERHQRTVKPEDAYQKAMKTQKADDWVKALEGRFNLD
jgi:hypothetical protein